MTAWTPAEIATSCWLDASDSANRTIVSSAFSVIADKSGNSKNATQTTAGDRPALITAAQNGRDVARFDGASDFMALVNVAQESGQHIILAGNTTTIATSFRKFLASTPGSDLGLLFGAAPQNYRPSIFWNGNQRGVQASAVQRKAVFRWRYVVGSPSSATTQIDGGAETTTTFTASALTNWGAIGESGAFPGFDFYEMVILPPATLSDDVDRVIGYIAWRWDLQSNLPVDHPYKDAAPVIISDDATATATPASIDATPGTGSAAAQRNINASATPAILSVTPGEGSGFVRIPATASATPAGLLLVPGTGRGLSGAELNYPTYRVVRDSYRDPIFSRGKVILSRPIEPGQRLAIERKTPITQLVPFTRDEPFSAEGFEYAMDKITFIQQEIEGHACDCRPKDAEDDAEDNYYEQNPECEPYDCEAIDAYFLTLSNYYLARAIRYSDEVGFDFPFGGEGNLQASQSSWGGNIYKATVGNQPFDVCGLRTAVEFATFERVSTAIRDPGYIRPPINRFGSERFYTILREEPGSKFPLGTLLRAERLYKFHRGGVPFAWDGGRMDVALGGGSVIDEENTTTLMAITAISAPGQPSVSVDLGNLRELWRPYSCSVIYGEPIIEFSDGRYRFKLPIKGTAVSINEQGETKTIELEYVDEVINQLTPFEYEEQQPGDGIFSPNSSNQYLSHMSAATALIGSLPTDEFIDEREFALIFKRNQSDYQSPDYCIFPKD